MRLNLLLGILLILFLSNLVSSATVVQVQQPEEQKSTFNPFSLLTNGYFWLVIGGIFLLVCLVIAGFFLGRWVMNYLKTRNDVFFKIRRERIRLAKIHRRYNSTHWFKITKNTPIRLAKRENGQVYLSKPIGYHRGDYITHEGNLIITFNMEGKNKLFVYPETDILIIPNRDKISISQRNAKGQKTEIVLDNIPKAEKLVQFNENEIIIYAESISQVGLFHIPVLKSVDGKVMDLSLPIFASLREVVLGEYLYDQSTEFTQLSKEAMGINPHIRAIQKTSDSNQQVDLNNQV